MSEYPYTKLDEFKGNQLLKIIVGTWTDTAGNVKENSISFGIKKAQAILSCLGDIERFVEGTYEETEPAPPPSDDPESPF